MTDVDLNFLAKQQDRILSELAEMRIEFSFHSSQPARRHECADCDGAQARKH